MVFGVFYLQMTTIFLKYLNYFKETFVWKKKFEKSCVRNGKLKETSNGQWF